MNKPDKRKRPARRGRSYSRRLALQALYQWQIARHNLAEIEKQFLEDQDVSKADLKYFQELLHKIPACTDELTTVMAPHLDRSQEVLDPIERAILWIGIYELAHQLDIPYRVVINESVELAKDFGAEQGHKFINGVLDKAAKVLREQEINKR